MEKPTTCIGENKGADQLGSTYEANQHLCFGYMDSRIPLLLKSKISIFKAFTVTVQAGLCQTWSKTQIVDFLMQRLKYELKHGPLFYPHLYKFVHNSKIKHCLQLNFIQLNKVVLCSINYRCTSL